jgi:hypothetical protein
MTYPQQPMPHLQQTYQQQRPVPPKRSPWRWIVPFAVVGVVFLGILIASFVSDSDGTSPSGFVRVSQSQLEAARDRCGAGDLRDGGNTLILDMEGEEPGSGSVTFDDSICVLAFLDVPASVSSRMDSTRALDGMLDAEWDGFEASWTYHPDDGLDVIITTVD